MNEVVTQDGRTHTIATFVRDFMAFHIHPNGMREWMLTAVASKYETACGVLIRAKTGVLIPAPTGFAHRCVSVFVRLCGTCTVRVGYARKTYGYCTHVTTKKVTTKQVTTNAGNNNTQVTTTKQVTTNAGNNKRR